MAAVDIDRQAIERRDFPIARRGYEPAAVDSHLRELANEIEELQHELSDGGGETSLASTAGTQVQSILAAAEAAAVDIEQQAREAARTAREEADRDATSTRDQAVAQARGQVAFVANATAALLERVASMDAEVSALVESLRTGANRLAADLAAVETNMGELYDAAAGQAVTHAVSVEPPATIQPAPPIPAPPIPQAVVKQPPLSPPETTQAEAHVDPEAPPAAAAAASSAPASPPATNGDLDGARLIALNMALNGESRADAERYLAENFKLADRQKLIDEVYQAIEA
jgi:hypothetical protein